MMVTQRCASAWYHKGSAVPDSDDLERISYINS